MQPLPDHLVATLSVDPWFQTLPAAQQRALLARCRPLRLAQGQAAFAQGDPVPLAGQAFFGIVQGVVKMTSPHGDGDESLVAVLGAGGWFGELSLLDGLPRAYSAVAVTDVELLALSAPAFRSLMRSRAFADAMARLLAARLRRVYEVFLEGTLRSTRARLARRLVLLAGGAVAHNPPDHAVVPVSQDSLARTLGVTRQTLNKELKAMAEAGALSLRYGRIEIASMALLDKLASAG
ncbi:MAG TPA: Crp/Fnr family transcriptional regulator [Ramlibacter sp.]|nr:Crp/Fnr family transcriptional regulator [Ramlibacter sp.]